MIHTVKHLVALNDPDGNPRRVFVGFDHQGQVVAVADEGYLGLNCAPWVHEYAQDEMIEAVNITVSEYNHWARKA